MGKMQPNDFIVKTIVTTELIKAAADKNKIEMRDCYTGFKWIVRKIRPNPYLSFPFYVKIKK